MQLLVKDMSVSSVERPAAHIPDSGGHPLCRSRLNPDTWHMIERDSTQEPICGSCRRILAIKERKRSNAKALPVG
jgi:hypothetical protein